MSDSKIMFTTISDQRSNNMIDHSSSSDNSKQSMNSEGQSGTHKKMLSSPTELVEPLPRIGGNEENVDESCAKAS